MTTDVVLITINPATGAATLVATTGLKRVNGGNITDLSFRNSDNVLYGHRRVRNDNNELYTINTGTAAATLKGNTGLNTSGNGIAFSPTDTLYLIGDNDVLYSLDQSDGASTDTGVGLDFTGLATICPPRTRSARWTTSRARARCALLSAARVRLLHR